jgi:hypothetical protein
MADSEVLLTEDNPISLRTATVLDDGNLVYLSLSDEWHASSISRKRSHREMLERALLDSVWLYRHPRSSFEEVKLRQGSYCAAQDLRPLAFKNPPELRIVWTDTGNGLALFLNGEPWAFIDEQTRRGYSKGFLDPADPEAWNEELFRKIFEA